MAAGTRATCCRRCRARCAACWGGPRAAPCAPASPARCTSRQTCATRGCVCAPVRACAFAHALSQDLCFTCSLLVASPQAQRVLFSSLLGPTIALSEVGFAAPGLPAPPALPTHTYANTWCIETYVRGCLPAAADQASAAGRGCCNRGGAVGGGGGGGALAGASPDHGFLRRRGCARRPGRGSGTAGRLLGSEAWPEARRACKKGEHSVPALARECQARRMLPGSSCLPAGMLPPSLPASSACTSCHSCAFCHCMFQPSVTVVRTRPLLLATSAESNT